jgi:GT2 family glycosyltransferase
MNDRPPCSVVIPTYNGRHLLETCLASIERHRPESIALEVIVADDASTDDTASWLARHHPEVRLVRLAANGGFCQAANAGIRAARGRFIQLLNNDTEVTPGWLEAGLALFDDPKVGSVAPLVLMRSDPTRVDSAGDGYALTGWPYKRGHGQPARLWENRPEEQVFGASASSAFYRASALRMVGGFDPAYGSYYEDVDLAFRLRWVGYSCVFTPKCRVLHDVSATFDHARPALQRRVARNAEYLFWTNLSTGRLLLGLLPHLGFTCVQALWRAGRGRLGPMVAGKADAVRSWRALRDRRLDRARLARSAIARPHFPIQIAALDSLRRQIARKRDEGPRALTKGIESSGPSLH